MLLLTTWTGASHAADLATCTEPGAAEMVMHVGAPATMSVRTRTKPIRTITTAVTDST